MKTMRRVGSELIQERKKHFMEDEKSAFTGDSEDWHHKDLLSALLKANMDSSIPESQRMTDEEVLSRKSTVCVCNGLRKALYLSFWFLEIPTFLVAGHETSR